MARKNAWLRIVDFDLAVHHVGTDDGSSQGVEEALCLKSIDLIG